MVKERNLFLDYGGLIFNYDFNKQTLFRAHKLALDYITSVNGYKISLNEITQAHNKAIQAYLEARQKDNSEWPIEKIMSLFLQNLVVDASVSDVSAIYKLNDHDATPMSNARESLQRLAVSGKLGIISNLPHDSLIYELKRESMLNLFNPIIISYQVGFRKPHQKIYQEALRRANTTAENSIFISHDKEEVIGAENVGIRGILVNSLEEAVGVI